MTNSLYIAPQHKHTQQIDALVAANPGMKKHGFWRAVHELAGELGSEIPKGRFLPDAYRIDRDTCTVEMHEVVCSNDLTPEKLRIMGAFWADWDCEGQHDWLPTLFAHREGALPTEYDLCHWYYSEIDIEIARLSPQHKKEEADAE